MGFNVTGTKGFKVLEELISSFLVHESDRGCRSYEGIYAVFSRDLISLLPRTKHFGHEIKVYLNRECSWHKAF
jgi:hypothetical protein